MRRKALNGLAVIFAACVVWCSASSAHAQDRSHLQWNPHFSRFSTAQYGMTLALAGGLFASNTMLRESSSAAWRDELLLDHEARSLLSASSARGQRDASEVSDYLALGLVIYPFAIDTALVAGVGYQSYDVAFQMAMIGAQAVLTAKLVSRLTKVFVGRARPGTEQCVTGDEAGCGSYNESFVSGHTTTAFVGAGLICAQHQNIALYGDGPYGAIACGAALATASAVGTLRMVADRHHLTDVLSGAVVGLGAGWLMPNLLNYNFGADRGQGGQIAPFVDHDRAGLVYTRTF